MIPLLLLGVFGFYLYKKGQSNNANASTNALNTGINQLATKYPAADTTTSTTPTVNADGSSSNVSASGS